MKYTTVESPTWNRDGTMIDCIVTFERIGRVPFSAHPNDLPHSVEIYNRCIAGDFGPIADYVPYLDEGDNPQSAGPIPELPKIPATDTGEVL